MRFISLTAPLCAILLLGAALPASARDDHHGGKKGRHDECHETQGERSRDLDRENRHAGRHDGMSRHEHHEERSERESHDWQERRGWREHGGWGEHDSWREHRCEHWEREHRTWAQRGGYGGFFIPHERFVLWFGPRHFFRIGRPVIYLGYPRFVYRETSFIFVDPYPAAWGETWYDSDDVYVDYSDGYYLHNRRHPGVAIAISIVN